DAGGEAGLGAHAAAQLDRDPARAAQQAPRAAHVEEGLVDGQRLDQRRHVAEQPHHLRRHLEVAVEVGLHGDRRGAQAQRLRHRHRRAHAEPARLVRGTGDDPPALGGADDDRLALQTRIVEHLDRGVEGVHIDVQDAGAGVVRAFRRDDPAGAVAASHATILTGTADVYCAARSSTSSRTRAASAWPFIAFMTAPMIAPAAWTLPSRIFSSTSGWEASASSMAAMRAPSSETTASPRASTISCGEPSPAIMPSSTCRASLSV